MNFLAQSGVSGVMTNPDEIDLDTEELISRLLTRVGMLMEDASTYALICAPCTGGIADRVDRIGKELDRMASLCTATKALLDD